MAKEKRQFDLELNNGKIVSVQQIREYGERYYTTNEGGVYYAKKDIIECKFLNKKESKESIQSRIDKNRDEIDRLLSKNIPLDLLYIRVNMLKDQNEELIKKLIA